MGRNKDILTVDYTCGFCSTSFEHDLPLRKYGGSPVATIAKAHVVKCPGCGCHIKKMGYKE